ncbi:MULTISPECIES: YkgJ family cysteine cluster protein [Dysgonomonas]|uniref:YkgJ family cysteine cluster protein n=1 Tax=Dysgonomonas TaxID=156973 RepID=UPI000928992F|nr:MULTISPECIES: YkgJ family cysteine cluster protein [Dysgonomonas]OJX58231.1 MAG: zinc/iron-chelating domain-containing protein [Dysgonomonas sp. 37-18]
MKQYENLQVLAEKAKPLFLQYYKKNKKRLGKMDTIVQQLHDEVSENIDCLTCANCCRSLGPAIYDKDIERMAKALRIKPSEVVSSYLRIDEDGDYVFKSMPCPFLMNDNYCSIYESRPKACREYPHTDRKNFEQIYKLTVKNTSTCPIAYEVLCKLMDK